MAHEIADAPAVVARDFPSYDAIYANLARALIC